MIKQSFNDIKNNKTTKVSLSEEASILFWITYNTEDTKVAGFYMEQISICFNKNNSVTLIFSNNNLNVSASFSLVKTKIYKELFDYYSKFLVI